MFTASWSANVQERSNEHVNCNREHLGGFVEEVQCECIAKGSGLTLFDCWSKGG